MESDKRINEVMNERAILISTKFDNLNRLITTTKNDQYLCLVLELAQGIDIVQLIRTYKKLPESLVKLIILQLSYTLDYFRQECIIYKDLKASHVFISTNLRVELIDLGLAE